MTPSTDGTNDVSSGIPPPVSSPVTLASYDVMIAAAEVLPKQREKGYERSAERRRPESEVCVSIYV